MAPEILIILWYFWTGQGLQPATRNTLGPDPDNRIIGADT